jgi:hypothetical protein
MRRIRLVVSTLAFGLALLPLSAVASTTTTYYESVHGVETGFPVSTDTCQSPDSVSSFAGLADGTLNGGFAIAVCHTPLTFSGATIKGGAFTISNAVKTVTGAFAGGTVGAPSVQHTGYLCTEKFVVNGGLLPSGEFVGKLAHYGFWTGSSCNVFFATISGNAKLTA